jgi:hypothetical protein
MLRDEDIKMERGRASHGGDFLRLTHIPSGITRSHPGPLGKGNKQHLLISSWLSEIEAELRAQGLIQYIIPEHGTKRGSPKRHRP